MSTDDEKTYLGRDLQDCVDSVALGRRTASRTQALEAVLPDEAEVHSERSGGYQGELVLVVELDGYIWLTHDWYGSCSYCDGFLADRVEYIEQIIPDFYCFETTEDAIQYLDNSVDFGWDGAALRAKAKDLLEDLEA